MNPQVNPQVQVQNQQDRITQVLDQLKTDLERHKALLHYFDNGKHVSIHVPIKNTEFFVDSYGFEIERPNLKLEYSCRFESLTIKVDKTYYEFKGVVATFTKSELRPGYYHIHIMKHRDNYEIVRY